MAWVLLIGAALLEVVWATALGRSEGFTRPWPTTIGIVGAVASFVLLTIAMRDLPVGTAYAVWVGLGAVGVVLLGIIVSGESASPLRLACLALIVVGVVGLKLA
ncbi:multidrug efflux SMR transporter [Actinosynnema sp. NPDC023658]|uniref:DMT family transporter n=1 Tax=Actinosynnema sp. NPDC023658 TaxID=3155465 RepID=UPI0033F4A62C